MIDHLEKEGVKSRLGVLLSEFHRRNSLQDELKYSYLGPEQKGKDIVMVDNKCVTAQTLTNAVDSAFARGAGRVFSFIPHNKMSSACLQ